MLIGRTDLEDALKRLEKLTDEEVRMATAQVLKVTHTVNDRVAGVDDCVKAIDDKVAVVIDGAQPSLIGQQQNIFNSDVPRGKRDKGSHTTSCRRHGSSEKLLIFFLH
jgi:hypothetical protein